MRSVGHVFKLVVDTDRRRPAVAAVRAKLSAAVTIRTRTQGSRVLLPYRTLRGFVVEYRAGHPFS